MGQTVYVLTTKTTSKEQGKVVREWRPVGVVTSPQHADEWANESDNNDWIPLELDDMTTVVGEHSVTPFRPKKPQPVENKAEEAIKNVNEINTRLIDILERLATKHKEKEILTFVQQMKRDATAQQQKPSQKRTSAIKGKFKLEYPDWDREMLEHEGFSGETLENEIDKRWKATHSPNCGLQHPGASHGDCDCKIDRLGTMKMGCKDCGCEWDEPHDPKCPRMAQKRLFSSLLRAAKVTSPPKPAGFENTLQDDQAIADYIETWAGYEVDTEFVQEQFRGEHAVLKLLPIAGLVEAGRDHNLQSPANEKKYQRMSINTIPPLLVRDNKVLDGNHRLRASKKRGLTHMWCYVVQGNEGV